MKSMDALLIIKKELYKDTLPTVEVQNALDCLEEYITTPRVKVTSEALANIRKNTLKEFVEWLKGQNCIIMQQDCAGTMKCDFALEKFLEDRK